MTFEIANYNDHRAVLTALLQQPCSKPVLFIKGEKAYGKTWLLRWFRAELGTQCRLLKFDFADPQQLLSPSFILRKCSQALGEGHFPNFEREAPVYKLSRTATISNVTVTGDDNIITADAGGTPEEQLLVAMDLTRFFVDDLKKLAEPHPPIVFAFDHVEKAKPLTSTWLREALIPALQAVPHSRVVLASTDFPALDEVSWEPASATITLTGVSDANAWYSLIQLLGKSVPPQAATNPIVFLQGIIMATKGVPGTLMPIIQTFP